MTKDMKRTIRKSVRMTYSVQQVLTTGTMTFQTGKTYRTIKSIAKAFNANVPIRRGFGYVDSAAIQHKVAVWCISTANKVYWENSLEAGETVIKERRLVRESPTAFQQRIRNDSYDADVYRLTFVKENGTYRFVGVFMVAAFDVKNATVVFEKVHCPSLQFWIKRETRKRITVTIEEETSEPLLVQA